MRAVFSYDSTANFVPLAYKFTGKERDTESGNDYFGARYYSSAMGRFMSPDWSAKEEPVPYAKLDDPQSLNLYAYVRNNPLIRVDADGHIDWDYLKDKFKQVFYAKASVGAGFGGELKLTKGAGLKAEVKAGLETKATVKGERTVAKIEGSVGAKVGEKEAGKSGSVEMQVEKDGKLDIQKPTFECCTLSMGSASTDGNEIGIGGHDGPFGGEVGIDVDKGKEFVDAVKEQVNSEIDNAVKKILPN
jgi:RHS repeat-associated protein